MSCCFRLCGRSSQPITVAEIQLEESWKIQLQDQFALPYMQQLRQFLQQQLAAGKQIYPRPSNWFRALDCTPFEQVRVVILGQDPYHGPGQAHGLSFSVPDGVALPPSLRNIYKEIERDLGIQPGPSGNLERWARQGVLLLNATLSVEAAQAGSHQGKGWEQFTDTIVERLNQRERPMAFMLWGSYAQRKGEIINPARHLVLKTSHPSPLSAHRGFLGSGVFSAVNQWLHSQGEQPVDWR